MERNTLLIEIGTEELPPKSLKRLSEAFSKEIAEGLFEAELIESATYDSFASPRRLAVQIPHVVDAQPDQEVERRGPAVQAAFDESGQPTPAAIGFARSCGVDVDDLQRLSTDKGEWLSYNVIEKGKSLKALIDPVLEQAIKRLPIAKRMRWGSGDAEFVRPVKWLMVLHGRTLLPASVLGVESAATTRGHRFQSKGDLSLWQAEDYEQLLLKQGEVVADFAKRRELILEQITHLAKSVDGQIETDNTLLDEVTGLVEKPHALLGEFDASFLSVPEECLISSMRDHQKYFHVKNASGELLPNFITVSNIASKNPASVRKGNEKVLRARLADARFFWESDLKVALDSRIDRLKNVLFHEKLGSLLDKTNRLKSLADWLAPKLGANSKTAMRAAELAKADLVSDMVGEFDALQGVMGHYYAAHAGEDQTVSACIEQHYWPRFAGDDLPESPEAQTVALADRLDSLVGLYGVGEVPTGDKDPYGLRRAALAILRILIESGHNLSLAELVSDTAETYQKQGIDIDATKQVEVVEFVLGRLTAFYQSQNIDTKTIQAVMACLPDRPLDFDHRVKAVYAFTELSDAVDLIAANKRIRNILKKQDTDISAEIDETALTDDAEKALARAIIDIEKDCEVLFDAGFYEQGLSKLATLRVPVDRFFENVMVMSDNPVEKANRLSLLKRLQNLFFQVADISLLQG